MKYIEYKVEGVPDEESSEIVVAELADLGFESFSDYSSAEASLSAYIPAPDEIPNRGEIEAYLIGSGYPYERIEGRDDTNWNAEWESNFPPIVLENRCYIRAPFHEKREDVAYQIVIMPKMSFGTGHHATTCLMLDQILKRDFSEQIGLDMGSGTGVLAILAVMRGATHVDAIDIDRWAYENCLENVGMNGVLDRVTVREGDASLLGESEKYDFILANINRNILLNDMEHYVRVMKPGGIILLSGFLEVDVPVIRREAESLGLAPEIVELKEGWALVTAQKS